VTLARLRHGTDRDLAEYLALRGGFASRPFEVDRFVLFSSRDSVGGGPYVVEGAYDLRRKAA
jgi:2'-5' RNA ligase